MSPRPTPDWAPTAIIITIIIALCTLCIAGPAPEFAGWFR
jgi:hypothetical protein